jgi:hypothetical protein
MAKTKPKLESVIVQLRWQNNSLGQVDGETILVAQIDAADFGNDPDAVNAHLGGIARERKAEIPQGWWPQIRLCGNAAEAQARLVSLIRGIR